MATALAVAEWNTGSLGTLTFMSHLNLQVSETSMKSAAARDKNRLRKSELAVTAKDKARKASQKAAKQRELDRLAAEEEMGAGPSYCPGAGAFSNEP